MNTETITTITETVLGHEAKLVVRHDGNYVHEFRLVVGCVDEWMEEADVRTIVKLLNAGLRKHKAVTR